MMVPMSLYHDYHEERVRRAEQYARERDIQRMLQPNRPGLAARIRAMVTAALPEQEPRPQEARRSARVGSS